MTPSQHLTKAVNAAYAAGMTYEQIVSMVKSIAALKEHSLRA